MIAALLVGQQVIHLLIAPRILSNVEEAAPLHELLAAIAGFTAVIFGLSVAIRYLQGATFIPRVDIHTKLITDINYKCFVTAYPNREDVDHKALL